MKIESESHEQTRAFAVKLAEQLRPGDVVLMRGDLGSGKTCVSQGIAEGLGCTDVVSSPTFTLVQEYGGGRLHVNHVDLYRLEGPRHLESLGLDEYFDGDGVTLVEWAERLDEAAWPLPAGCWRLNIERVDETRRKLELSRS